MRTFNIILGLVFITLASYCQEKVVSNNDEILKVYKGDVIKVKADSAYVISISRAVLLNRKLEDLDTIQVLYNDLAVSHSELLGELKSTRSVLEKLTQKMTREKRKICEEFDSVFVELDNALTYLRTNNEELKKNNNALAQRVGELERIARELKKETRGIWISGTTDKLLVFAGGVGVGMLLMAFL